jgi:hypothetical protein
MKVTWSVTHSTREIVAGACGFLAVVGCFGLFLVDSLHFPFDSLAYRLIDNTIFVGALFGLVLAFLRAEEPIDDKRLSLTSVTLIAACAGILTLAAVAVHYRGFPSYPILTAFTTGLAAVALVFVLNASSATDGRTAMFDRRLLRMTLVLWLLAGATIVIRLLAPGAGFLMWVLAPVYVLMMPGLGLGAVLLPSSTDWIERLVWAPVMSVCFQVVILMWMNTLGLAVSVPTLFVLAGATTFLSAIAAMLRYDELPL